MEINTNGLKIAKLMWYQNVPSYVSIYHLKGNLKLKMNSQNIIFMNIRKYSLYLYMYKFIVLVYVYECFALMYISEPSVCLAPIIEGRRGNQIPLNWGVTDGC